MAATAEISRRHYELPVTVEALRADMTIVAQIVVKTVDGICDIDPVYPLALAEEPFWVRFRPKGQQPITIKLSELSVFQKS